MMHPLPDSPLSQGSWMGVNWKGYEEVFGGQVAMLAMKPVMGYDSFEKKI